MFSYLSKAKLDELDYEDFFDGEVVHLRKKSTQEPFSREEEKRIFMELHEKYGIAWRAQYQHNGFWGTALRNDGKRGDFAVPQGIGDYEWNKSKDLEPSVDTWPRMYSEAWLKS